MRIPLLPPVRRSSVIRCGFSNFGVYGDTGCARHRGLWSAFMRLASYIAHGRASFGAVVGDGVVDFRLRFGSRFATLVDLIRANMLDEARAVMAGVRPDFPLSAIEL